MCRKSLAHGQKFIPQKTDSRSPISPAKAAARAARGPRVRSDHREVADKSSFEALISETLLFRGGESHPADNGDGGRISNHGSIQPQ